MSDEAELQLNELSTDVFEKLLAALEKEGLPEEVRARLRQTLLVDSKFTDTALRIAVFGEESSK